MKNDVHHSREKNKKRVAGWLWLMDAWIELLERKREIDVIDRKVVSHRRDARQQQQSEEDDPK